MLRRGDDGRDGGYGGSLSGLTNDVRSVSTSVSGTPPVRCTDQASYAFVSNTTSRKLYLRVPIRSGRPLPLAQKPRPSRNPTNSDLQAVTKVQ